MVSVVNGYVCFSSCDEAKAKQGNNPNGVPGSRRRLPIPKGNLPSQDNLP